jgi:hypothetical protein
MVLADSHLKSYQTVLQSTRQAFVGAPDKGLAPTNQMSFINRFFFPCQQLIIQQNAENATTLLRQNTTKNNLSYFLIC